MLRWGGGTGGVEGKIAVGESRKEMADRVARHQADEKVEHDVNIRLGPIIGVAGSTVVFLCLLFLVCFFFLR